MATGDKGGRIVLFQSSDKSEDEDNNKHKNDSREIESAWYLHT